LGVRGGFQPRDAFTGFDAAYAFACFRHVK
jgi:hypothetical protein